jgi:hypothetical protein
VSLKWTYSLTRHNHFLFEYSANEFRPQGLWYQVAELIAANPCFFRIVFNQSIIDDAAGDNSMKKIDRCPCGLFAVPFDGQGN